MEGVFEGQWSVFILKYLSLKDKRAVSQVSRSARKLVYDATRSLTARCAGSLSARRFLRLRHLEIQVRCFAQLVFQLWYPRLCLGRPLNAIDCTGDLTELDSFVKGISVTSLVIRSNILSVAVVDAISGLLTLEKLDLRFSTIADIGAIASLCKLSELDLQHVPQISKIEDLSRLSGLRKLATLRVGHSDVDRALLHDFQYFFPYLRELDMSYSQRLTHSGANIRFSSFSNLVSLTLDGYADMRDLTPLQHLGRFKSFAFRDCNLQNEWLTSLTFTNKLETLALSNNSSLNDGGIRQVTVLQSLRILECNDLEHFSKLGASDVILLLPTLKRFEVKRSGVDVCGLKSRLSKLISTSLVEEGEVLFMNSTNSAHS